MKLIKVRDQVEKGALGAALIFSTMPIIGVLTGVSFGTGYSSGYFEILLKDDPGGYWYIIALESVVVVGMICLAFFDFPLIKYSYEKVISYKEENKVISYIGLYLIFPILFLVFIFSLPFIF